MPFDMSTYTGVDLVGDGPRNEFRAAMMDLKKTFHKAVILYRKADIVFDKFNEDRRNNTSYTDYTLDCLVEYSQLVEDKYVWTSTGAVAEARARITLNNDYLTQLGLWNAATNTCTLNGKIDRLYLGGVEFRITEIPVYDGQIEAKSIHTLIYVEPAEKMT